MATIGKPQSAEVMPRGVVLDVPPFAAPPDAYTDCQNMRVTGGGMRRADGVRKVWHDIDGGYLFPPRYVQTVVRQGELFFLYAGDAGVGVTDGLSHHDVTPLSGWGLFQNGEMTGANYNGVGCFSYPDAPPWYWDGGLVPGSVKPLPGFLANSYCRTLQAFGSHLFAGSIIGPSGTNNERLAWSDIATYGSVPATWTPTATNQAGELQLTTGAGAIVAMRGLGTSLMIYRATGCYAVTYVGRPYIYVARKLSADVGAASSNSVAEFQGNHVVLAPGDLVVTDGVTWRSIGESRVKRSLFSQISEEGLRVAHVYAVPGRSEIVFALPLGTDDVCNTLYAWNYQEDKWSVREAPGNAHTIGTYVPEATALSLWDDDAGTWDSDFVAWNASPQGGFTTRPLAACPNAGSLVVLDVGDVDLNGAALNTVLERRGLVIGDPSTVKQFTRVFLRVDATPGTLLTVQVGAQIDPGDPVTWEPAQPYTVGSGQGVTCSAMGRYFSLRVQSQTVNPFTLSGFNVEFRTRGFQ